MNVGLFDRDGHLSELGLDRLAVEAETLAPEIIASANEHLTTCAICRAAHNAMTAFDATFAIKPRAIAGATPATGVNAAATIATTPIAAANDTPVAVPRSPRPATLTPLPIRRRALGALLGVVAMAALALLVVRPTNSGPDPLTPPDDTLRPKGGEGFDFNIWIHDGNAPVLAAHTDFPVRPGDRMGFVASHPKAGHLLVIGRDDTGQTYACFPQADTQPFVAGPVPARPTPAQLPGAMAFDTVPGRERVAAIFCPETFDSNDLPADPCAAASAGRVSVGAQSCLIRCVTLAKTPLPSQPEGDTP